MIFKDGDFDSAGAFARANKELTFYGVARSADPYALKGEPKETLSLVFGRAAGPAHFYFPEGAFAIREDQFRQSYSETSGGDLSFSGAFRYATQATKAELAIALDALKFAREKIDAGQKLETFPKAEELLPLAKTAFIRRYGAGSRTA